MSGSNSRRLSLIALLTALAVVLNLTIAIQAPFASYLYYEVWEVPILLAFLLLGLWSGITVAALNGIILEAHLGQVALGPVYNIIAVTSMFAGVAVAKRLASRFDWGTVPLWVSATALGAIVRTLVMTVVNAAVLPLPLPFGVNLPTDAVPATLVLVGVFNLTVTLYTVPITLSVQRALATRYWMPDLGPPQKAAAPA